MYSNPALEEAINNPDNRGTLKKQLNVLADAVNAPKSPIAKDTRASMQLAIQKIRSFIDFNENPIAKNGYLYQEQKAASKEEIAQILFELSRSNMEIREANRLIFTPILNSYARNVVGASPER
jgi:transcriptional regulator of NAD metabolism